MLGTLLLAGIIAAPLTSAALFAPVERPDRVAGAWPAARRLILALVATAVVGALLLGVLFVVGVGPADAITAVLAYAAMSLAWLPATRRQMAPGGGRRSGPTGPSRSWRCSASRRSRRR